VRVLGLTTALNRRFAPPSPARAGEGLIRAREGLVFAGFRRPPRGGEEAADTGEARAALGDARPGDRNGGGARRDDRLRSRALHPRRFCVLQQPGVFKAYVVGPWIAPDDATTTEAIVAVAQNCPSGAIEYQRKDGGPEEAAPPDNLIQIRENGPQAFRGDLVVDGAAIGFRATLCRCGDSKNTPLCGGRTRRWNSPPPGNLRPSPAAQRPTRGRRQPRGGERNGTPSAE
jgi:uncharacterized Fe-S cluster protein YjdI/CDGSH-type Zn-finger protein